MKPWVVVGDGDDEEQGQEQEKSKVPMPLDQALPKHSLTIR